MGWREGLSLQKGWVYHARKPTSALTCAVHVGGWKAEEGRGAPCLGVGVSGRVGYVSRKPRSDASEPEACELQLERVAGLQTEL